MKKESKENKGIKCDVFNCVYHEGDYVCKAEAIKVGAADACCCDDTRCSTFKIREDEDDTTIYPTSF